MRKVGALLSRIKRFLKGMVKLIREGVCYAKKHGLRVAFNRTIHYRQIRREKRTEKAGDC